MKRLRYSGEQIIDMLNEHQAGLPHCTAHGLRKAGATIAAENGADYELLKAIFGWTTAQQVTRYVEKARRTKIAARAGRFLFLEQKGN